MVMISHRHRRCASASSNCQRLTRWWKMYIYIVKRECGHKKEIHYFHYQFVYKIVKQDGLPNAFFIGRHGLATYIYFQ